jgi:hypothetical protein
MINVSYNNVSASGLCDVLTLIGDTGYRTSQALLHGNLVCILKVNTEDGDQRHFSLRDAVSPTYGNLSHSNSLQPHCRHRAFIELQQGNVCFQKKVLRWLLAGRQPYVVPVAVFGFYAS